MARADRTRSFVMPATAVVELLKKDSSSPALAQVRQDPQEPAAPARAKGKQARPMPGGEDRLRRHLSDMQRLMDHMREEMQALEER